uniref:Uncharacterized protein n=1 Tax=Piliocolobus tephrosceles TaxID=591936 RepID=A0A8C9H558_9PRIM
MVSAANTRIYHLKAYRELRIVTLDKPSNFEESDESVVKIRILPNQSINKNEKSTNCSAEIFGKELIVDKDYYFGYNEKFAIFTFTGCVIQIKGTTLQEYENQNNSIKEFLSLCYVLDAYRMLAKKKKTIGPRVLITGNNNAGKSTIAMLLLNYALKSNFKPIYIETDTKCTCDKITLNKGPGIISGFVYDNLKTTYSIDYLFGYSNIHEDIKLYYHINECISSCIYLMMLNNLSYQSSNFKNTTDHEILYPSGFILNVPSEADTDIIHNLIEIYNINIVIVIDNSFLYHSLKEYYNSTYLLDVVNETIEQKNNKTIEQNMHNTGTSNYYDNNYGKYYNSINNSNYNLNDTEHFSYIPYSSKNIESSNSIYSKNNNSINNNPTNIGNSTYNNNNSYSSSSSSGNNIYNNVNEKKDVKKKNIEILGMPKFDGVIPSDTSRLRYCRNLWYNNYFKKNIIVNNTPYKKTHLLTFRYSSTTFVKLDSNLAVPLSALPCDFKNIKRDVILVSIYNENIKKLTNCVLGVSYSKDIQYVHLMNMAAFVHIQSIREIEKQSEQQQNNSDHINDDNLMEKNERTN